MTKKLQKRFEEVGSQKNNPDPIVIARYLNLRGSCDWYATEYDPIEQVFFGFISIGNEYRKWGTFSLQELETFRDQYGDGLVRDMYSDELPISKRIWRHHYF